MRMKKLIIILFLFCLHITAFVVPVNSKAEEKFETYSYEEVTSSVGYITLSSNNMVKHVSSAFIIHQDDKYSYVASSLAASSKDFDAKLHFKGATLNIELVGNDSVVDLSIFRFDKSKYFAPNLKLASSTSLHIGESIYYAGLMGFANNDFDKPIFSKEQTFISKLDVLYCPNNYLFNCSNLMLIDTELSSYSQGGPIFNAYGYVIGMVSMNNPDSNQENGDKLYHATLSNDFNIFCNKILDNKLSRADLGIYIEQVEKVSAVKQEYLNISTLKTGTIITAVKDNASISGLGIDYVITKINEKEVKTTKDLISELYKYDKGTIIRVTAKKPNGKSKTYYVKG